jgi:hypothetical protein
VPKADHANCAHVGTKLIPKAFHRHGSGPDEHGVTDDSRRTRNCGLLDEFTRALYAKDPIGAIAPLADDAVTFDSTLHSSMDPM